MSQHPHLDQSQQQTRRVPHRHSAKDTRPHVVEFVLAGIAEVGDSTECQGPHRLGSVMSGPREARGFHLKPKNRRVSGQETSRERLRGSDDVAAGDVPDLDHRTVSNATARDVGPISGEFVA